MVQKNSMKNLFFLSGFLDKQYFSLKNSNSLVC